MGSITLDIAERVFSGRVIGVDMDERQLDIGRQNAEKRAEAADSFAAHMYCAAVGWKN